MILSKEDFLNSLSTYLPDNSTQQISPLDLRTVFTDLADSIHLMTIDQSITAGNVQTTGDRTTLLGDQALSKKNLAGRSTVDNSAFGYYSLHGNYDGTHNTALGSRSLTCNIYGDHNVAVGVSAAGGTTTGSGNVALGNYALHSNRTGSFNVAIGHGAGNYIGSHQSYKFYVASHEVQQDETCDDAFPSAIPLLHGDLKSNVLGVNVNSLDGFGQLQVEGAVSPADNALHSLGHGSRNWSSLHIASGILYPTSGNLAISVQTPKGASHPDQYTNSIAQYFDSSVNICIGTTETSGTQGVLTVRGNIIPHSDNTWTIGSPSLKWDGYFNDLVVSGNATINDIQYNTISSCLYECKTLHLATSGFCDASSEGLTGGSLCGYMSDSALEGAGFEIHSSGSDYVRDYKYIFIQSNANIPSGALEWDNAYSRSHWQSNISLEMMEGRHILTDRIIGRDSLTIIEQSGLNGFFSRRDPLLPTSSGSEITFGHVDYANNNIPQRANTTFYSVAGDRSYSLSIASPESGVATVSPSYSSAVKLDLDFSTAVSGSNKSGFKLNYFDHGHSDWDRFAITCSNPNDSYVYESLFINKSNKYVGISKQSRTSSATPDTPRADLHIFGNTSSDTVLRVGTRNSTRDSILELIGNGEYAGSGFRARYDTSSDIIDFSTILSSGKTGLASGFMSITNNNYIGIGSTLVGATRKFTAIEPLTINHSDAGASGTIAIKEQEKKPSNTAAYGKLYVKPVSATSQTQSLFFLDDSGNEFDVVANYIDNVGLLWSDGYFNTFAGSGTPQTLPVSSNNADNAAFGSESLNTITSASGNAIFGNRSLNNMTTGDKNVIVGHDNFRYNLGNQNNNIIVGMHNADSGNTSSMHNIIIGSENANSINDDLQYSIIIGNNLAPDGEDASRQLLIGAVDPIIKGDIHSLSSTGVYGRRRVRINEADFHVDNGDLVVTSGVIKMNVGSTAYAFNNGIFSSESESSNSKLSIVHFIENGLPVTENRITDTFNTSSNSGLYRLTFADANDGTADTLVEYDFRQGAMSSSPSFSSTSNPSITFKGDINVAGRINYADGTSVSTHSLVITAAGSGLTSVIRDSNVTDLHLDVLKLPIATNTSVNTLAGKSYIPIAVQEGNLQGNDVLGRMSVEELSTFIGSGYAGVDGFDNHVFAPPVDELNINTASNSGSIFIGPSVAQSATGWKYSVMIGSEAGDGATINNPNFEIDTNAIFIGHRSGKNADNTSNAVFIGTNAGNQANTSTGSIFIGQNAGDYSSLKESIGIGKNALRGHVSNAEGGSGNIEIVANLQDNERLLYNQGDKSNLLNIQNTVAGDTDKRRISIGDAVIFPDAVLSVRKDHTIQGHQGTDYIQTWHHNDELVSYINSSGNFVALQGIPEVIEGFTNSQVLEPSGYAFPSSGLLTTMNTDNSTGAVYYITNRDTTLAIHANTYVVARKIGSEYRPIHVACSGAS